MVTLFPSEYLSPLINQPPIVPKITILYLLQSHLFIQSCTLVQEKGQGHGQGRGHGQGLGHGQGQNFPKLWSCV